MRAGRHRHRVLVLSKVRAGGQRYYLDAVDPRNGPGVEAPGYWLTGTGRLALDGEVEARALGLLLEGRHPASGEELGADRQRVTVAGFDLTFCAPKSVSLLHALAEPDVAEAVGSGHDRAVAAALSYVEAHALAVRREVPGAGRAPVEVEVPPAAAFVHRTSRALDPHLHTHVLVANVGRGPDGSWSALDGRGLYAHRATADALYHAQLRHELTVALGVAWESPRGGRADVAGVGEEARRAFSRRSAQVLAQLGTAIGAEVAGSSRTASPRAREIAALVTRPPKDLSLSVEELRAEWSRRAREAGLGPRQIDAVVGRLPARARGATTSELSRAGTEGHSAGAEQRAMAGALEAAYPSWAGTSFARRHVVRAWASTCRRGEPARAVEERADGFLASDAMSGCPTTRFGYDGPGVAEARHTLAEGFLGRAAQRAGAERARAERAGAELAERRDLDEMLTRRGMVRAGERIPGIELERGAGLDR